MHRTTKNYPAQNVYSTKAEKACFEEKVRANCVVTKAWAQWKYDLPKNRCKGLWKT